MTTRRKLIQVLASSGVFLGIGASKTVAQRHTPRSGQTQHRFELTFDELTGEEFGNLVSSDVIDKEEVKSRLGVSPYPTLDSEAKELFDELIAEGSLVVEESLPEDIQSNNIIINKGSKYRINIIERA